MVYSVLRREVFYQGYFLHRLKPFLEHCITNMRDIILHIQPPYYINSTILRSTVPALSGPSHHYNVQQLRCDICPLDQLYALHQLKSATIQSCVLTCNCHVKKKYNLVYHTTFCLVKKIHPKKYNR